MAHSGYSINIHLLTRSALSPDDKRVSTARELGEGIQTKEQPEPRRGNIKDQ